MPTPAPTPLEVLQGRLAAYLAAEAKILEAQSYQVGDGSAARSLHRAQLAEVQRGIATVQGQINVLQGSLVARRRVLYLR